MDIDTLQGLRRCPLFNGLTESEIIDLMHMVRYRVVRCYKGDIHAMEATACQYADIIISGEMVASMMVSSGRIIRVAVHQSGKLLAPAFFFASDNQYPVTISRGNFWPQPFSLLQITNTPSPSRLLLIPPSFV